MKMHRVGIIAFVLLMIPLYAAAEERVTASRDLMARLGSFTASVEIRLTAGREDVSGDLLIQSSASTIVQPFARESEYSLRVADLINQGREYIAEGVCYTGESPDGAETMVWTQSPYTPGARYLDNLYDLPYITNLLAASADAFTRAGSEEIKGREADHFTGALSEEASIELINGLFADMGAALPEEIPLPALEAELWLNADNYPVRTRIDLLPVFAPWYETVKDPAAGEENALLSATLTIDCDGVNHVESIEIPEDAKAET